MHRRASMVLLLLCCAPHLIACTQTRTRLVPIQTAVPPDLLSCSDAPDAPDPNATQRTAALVVIALEDALLDCQMKLSAVRDLVTGQK